LRVQIGDELRPLGSEDVCTGEGTVSSTDDERMYALFDKVAGGGDSAFGSPERL